MVKMTYVRLSTQSGEKAIIDGRFLTVMHGWALLAMWQTREHVFFPLAPRSNLARAYRLTHEKEGMTCDHTEEHPELSSSESVKRRGGTGYLMTYVSLYWPTNMTTYRRGRFLTVAHAWQLLERWQDGGEGSYVYAPIDPDRVPGGSGRMHPTDYRRVEPSATSNRKYLEKPKKAGKTRLTPYEQLEEKAGEIVEAMEALRASV